MSKNKPPRDEGNHPLNEEVRGGYNSPRYEQKPKPPAKPPAKPKEK